MKEQLKIHLIRLTFCWIAIWLGGGFLVAQPENELGTPFIKNYTSKLYKGFPQIFGVTQDTSGIVYFTGNGIVEYDGETWRKIPPLGAVTWSIVLGNDDKIYVGGTDDLGYLESDSLGQQQFISLKSLVPIESRGFGQLRQAAVVKDDIYFASKTGYLIQYNSKRKSIRTWKKEPFYTLLGNTNGELFIDVPEEGLSKIVDGEIQLIAGGTFFSDIAVIKVLPYKEDQLLICTKNKGLFIYENNDFVPFQTAADEVLKSWLYDATILPDKTYVFSIIDQGIIVLNEEGEWLHHLNTSDGLQDNIVLTIHSSPSGSLWLGTNTGLCQVEILSPFSQFSTDENDDPLLLEDVIRVDDYLYAASGGTNGFLYLDKKEQVFRKVKNIPTGQAFSFLPLSNQLHGVGRGVYQLEEDQAKLIYKEKEASFLVFCEHESQLKKDYLFLGLQKGMMTIYREGQQWTTEGKIKDIPNNVAVKSFLEKTPGELWLGTVSQGLWRIDYKIEDASAQKINILNVDNFQKGIENLHLENTAVYLINDQITFTGTGGVFNFDESKNELVVDTRFALPASNKDIQKIILVENTEKDVYAHFLFFDGTAELGIYRKQTDGNYIFDPSLFQQLPKDELINVTKLYPEPNGVLWIAGQNGLYRFDRNKKSLADDSPIKIRTVFIGEDSLLYAGHGRVDVPVLTYNENDIRFHFLATSLHINGKNEYQTQLEGFDDTWSSWNTKIDRAYTNLPEGNYTFRVRGKSATGIFGQETTYSFRINPPWWRTWWAYLLYAVLCFSVVSIFSRWRNRRLRQQRENLQQIVRERTKEIEQRVEELSAINSLQEGLVALMDIDGIYKLVGDEIQKLFKANIAFIAILNKEEQMIHFPYGYGDDFSKMKLGEGLTSQILSSGKPLLINQEASQAYQELGIEEVGKKAASFLGVPINLGKEVIGVMSVQSTTQTSRFGETDERLLSTIASQVSIALYNAHLFEEAEKARAVAEESSEAKSTFLSTVSHELRTPLTSVIGFAKIIKKRLTERILPFVQSDEKKTHRAINQVTQNLDVVISEGERLTTLINTVLDLAKIEAGRLDWNVEPVEVQAIIQQATAATSSLFDQKSLPLNLEIEDTLPTINGDKDRLIQVLINLISNAVKFTDEGEVSIKAYQKDASIIVAVKDSGIGISDEDLPKVFEKFKQVGDTLTDKPKGTGLGLPICKEIIDYHEGDIWVESEIGKGSTFMFSIPLQKDAIIEKKPVDDAAAVVTKNMNGLSPKNNSTTILVVDDEASIRSLLRQEISELGYNIREAVNGKDALDSIRSFQPDLIILDVMMPKMNGFDLAAILKNDPITQDIPIIIVSIVDNQQRINQLGIDRYLTKPIDMGRLLKEIAVLLKEKEAKKITV